MREFFKVRPPEVRERYAGFHPAGIEDVPLAASLGRVLAADVAAQADLPPFDRSTMDGYAVRAAATFGASESCRPC